MVGLFCLTCMHMVGLQTFAHLLELWSVKMWCIFVLSYLYLRKTTSGGSTFFMMCYFCFHILINGSFPKQILDTECNLLFNRKAHCVLVLLKRLFFKKTWLLQFFFFITKIPQQAGKGNLFFLIITIFIYFCFILIILPVLETINISSEVNK